MTSYKCLPRLYQGVFLFLLSTLLFSCRKDEEEKVLYPSYFTVEIGDARFGMAGTESDPVEITVFSEDGSPVEDVNVFVHRVAGEFVVSDSVVTTNEEGKAYFTVAYGEQVGMTTVRVEVPGLQDSFEEINFYSKAGAVVSMEIVSGNLQEGYSGNTLNESMKVLLKDVFGNPVPNTTVSFSVVEGDAIMRNETSTSNSEGIASANISLGAESMQHVIRAYVPSRSEVFFTQFTLIKPQNVQLQSQTDYIGITWESQLFDNFESFEIHRGINGYTPEVLAIITDNATTNYKDYDVLPGDNYSYRVILTTKNGNRLINYGASIRSGAFTEVPGATNIEYNTFDQQLYLLVQNKIKTYVPETLGEGTPFPVDEYYSAFAFSEDHTQIYLLGNNLFSIYDLATESVVQSYDLSDKVTDYAFREFYVTKNGYAFFGTGSRYQIGLDLNTGLYLDNMPCYVCDMLGDDGEYLYISKDLAKVALTPDFPIVAGDDFVYDKTGPKAVYVASQNRIYNYYTEIYSGTDLSVIGQIGYGTGFDLSADGNTAYTSFNRGVKSWDTQTFQQIGEVPFGALDVVDMYVLPDQSKAILLVYFENGNSYQTKLFSLNLN